MPKIHISQDVKDKLSLLIENETTKQLKGKTGKDLTLAVLEMAKTKYGLSYSSMINKLIDNQ